MSARAAAALAAVVVATAVRADAAPSSQDDTAALSDEDPRRFFRTAVLAEWVTSAAQAERGILAMGGRLTLRIGPGAFVVSVEGPTSASTVQPKLGGLVLAGLGLVHNVSPRLDLHGALVGGSMWILVRDYIDGGWRSTGFPGELSGGARAGLEFRLGRVPRYPKFVLHPVLGVSVTLVHTITGSDRLRGIEWGGTAAFFSLTLGLGLVSYGPRLEAQAPEPAQPPL